MVLQAIAESFAECGDMLTESGSLAWRLAEALPLTLDEQQQLLEENNPQQRLQSVKNWLMRHPFDFGYKSLWLPLRKSFTNREASLISLPLLKIPILHCLKKGLGRILLYMLTMLTFDDKMSK
ncbi:MAG: LON peptidase substrate-binding domain-containing protein [Moraxellaceae bacterium]|nr:LON peptidase substrate-binding domain-containing protein [Moraxellaceae bacterium]